MVKTTTNKQGFPKFDDGDNGWGDDYNSFMDDLDEKVPYELATGTVTATGGSTPAVDTTITDVTTDQLQAFDVIVAVDSDPAFSADYAFNYDFSQFWDDSDGAVDVDLTVNWDTDPGGGNDVTLRYSIQERFI